MMWKMWKMAKIEVIGCDENVDGGFVEEGVLDENLNGGHVEDGRHIEDGECEDGGHGKYGNTTYFNQLGLVRTGKSMCCPNRYHLS